MKKLLEDYIIPGSLVVLMISGALSTYTGYDPNRTTTPTRALGGAVLTAAGAQNWGGILSFLIKPSATVFIISIAIYIIVYPKEFIESIINYARDVRERFRNSDN